MKLLAAVLILIAFVAVYVVWLRPWLRTKAWADGFFRLLEPVELHLWRKSETILWSRFLQVIGGAVPLLQFIGAIDITPYIAIVPVEKQPYLLLFIFLCGQIGVLLRERTTKPLEVVALPENKPPEVEAAIARAEGANDRAVASVEKAKAEGSV